MKYTVEVTAEDAPDARAEAKSHASGQGTPLVRAAPRSHLPQLQGPFDEEWIDIEAIEIGT
ncbi:MAG: hypothetical protein ACREC0_13150 [Methylocella sp.]